MRRREIGERRTGPNFGKTAKTVQRCFSTVLAHPHASNGTSLRFIKSERRGGTSTTRRDSVILAKFHRRHSPFAASVVARSARGQHIVYPNVPWSSLMQCMFQYYASGGGGVEFLVQRHSMLYPLLDGASPVLLTKRSLRQVQWVTAHHVAPWLTTLRIFLAQRRTG
jgi:hypothetical protein